jgi:LL-diaminopimelate aminotransferase
MTLVRREAASSRLRGLPAYLFEDLVRTRVAAENRGVDVIDLSIGDPDLGAPAAVVESLRRHAGDARLHSYTPPRIIEGFCCAVARWFRKRYGVDLDPEREVYPVVGTKEGLAHLPLAVMDPGDLALVPDPGYPVYSRGVAFAGGEVGYMALDEGHLFLPDLGALAGARPRLVFTNYPNNPTSAVAGPDFYRGLVQWARESGAYLASDAAYAEVAFDGYSAPSLLEADGAKDLAVEFHSFSKTFSMAGWRVGFVAGNAGLVGALRSLKSNIDSGVFGPILLASVAGLEEGWASHLSAMKEYGRRRELVTAGLDRCGIEYLKSPATLYVWAKVPGGPLAGRTPGKGKAAAADSVSMAFARALLEETGVLVAPGVGFGGCGEGYVRISITCPAPRVEAAMDRLAGACRSWPGRR